MTTAQRQRQCGRKVRYSTAHHVPHRPIGQSLATIRHRTPHNALLGIITSPDPILRNLA